MEIRHSEMKDLEEIMQLYARARVFMAEHGNPRQWGSTNWPPESLIRGDIENGKSYVCMDQGRIAATFFFDQGEEIEPCYREIQDGAWLAGGFYGVVHRIAASTDVKGAGTFCLNWAFEQCRHLRIDTHGDNKVMQSLLTKLGFTQCGVIYVEEDNDPRLAYEKMEKQLQ